MSVSLPVIPDAGHEAATQLREAAAAKKCWCCGCLHSSLKAIQEVISPNARPAELDSAIQAARSRLVPV